MEKSANETVIIVHGTWAAPDPVERRWYQPIDERPCGEPFTARLDAALAASALADYVAKLRTEGWHCHIVAHSHGGNVLAETLPRIMTALESKKPQAKLVTLGTPFLDTMSPILERTKTRLKLLQVVSWIGFASLMALALYFLHLTLSDPTSQYITVEFLFGFAGVFLLAILFGRMRRRTIDNASQPQPKLLAIGSPYDEAWQILHHLGRMENPIAIESNVLVYLFSSLRSAISQGKTVARIHGAKSFRDLGIFSRLAVVSVYLLGLAAAFVAFALSGWIPFLYTFATLAPLLFVLILVFTAFFGETFFSAFLSPYRWCFRQAGSLASIFPALATYGVRYSGWSVLLKMIMGLESYRFKIPVIEQQPGYVTYEDMPAGAQLRALDRRNAWIAGHLGDITQTFSKLAVTAADVTSLLKAVEKDQTLVHAAYYTDEECIARIADWIAREG